MAYNETLHNRLREALAELPDVEEKFMFGGSCFMVNGKMCIGVVGDKMMCRIGEDAYEKSLEMEGCTEMMFTGKPMKGYVYVEEEGYNTPQKLNHWVDACLAFNVHAKASKKKK